jgi:hypothetical protein
MERFLAHFDGKYLLPHEPVDLPVGKPLEVTAEVVAALPDAPPLNLGEWLDAIEAECGLVEGPEDWAAELDHYLYGAPKRGERRGG